MAKCIKSLITATITVGEGNKYFVWLNFEEVCVCVVYVCVHVCVCTLSVAPVHSPHLHEFSSPGGLFHLPENDTVVQAARQLSSLASWRGLLPVLPRQGMNGTPPTSSE